MAIQIKAIEQYFPGVLFVVQGGSNFCVTIQMKAIEQYFPVVLVIMLY